MLSYLCFALVFVAAYNAASSSEAPDNRNPICQQRNAFYKVDTSCDSYVECIEFVATDMVCPDGLHYNPDAKWPSYPCAYPMDVSCQGQGSSQLAQPTADCPHQYGFFASPAATPDNCGQYSMCVAGKAIEMVCPTGLAFNPDSSRCDWPDLVSTCKADDFLGFSCPPAPTDADGNLVDTIINYKYEGNCYYFFACEQGRARLLSCDSGLAFDADSGRCIDADNVDCSASAK